MAGHSESLVRRFLNWLTFLPVWAAYRLIWAAAYTRNLDAQDVYLTMWVAGLDLPKCRLLEHRIGEATVAWPEADLAAGDQS